MFLLALLGVPALVALAFLIFGGGRTTLKEFFLQLVVQSVLIGIVALFIHHANTTDYEVWNGRVANKAKERVSCSHSYTCNCHQVCSGSGSSRHCSTRCSTCYEHSHDFDWAVYTTNNERLEIDRVNRQGTETPLRWSRVQIGEPTAVQHSYENYIKGAPGTLFRRTGEPKKYPIPPYPLQIFDYYRLRRVVAVDVPVPDLHEWDRELAELNADLGATKQVNVVIVLVRNQPRDYFYELEARWIGGKKNDLIAVMSVDNEGTLQWAELMAWSTNHMVKVATRDAIMSLGKFDRRAELFQALRENISEHYVRKPMSDFAYLKSSIVPTPGQMVGALIVSMLLSIGLALFFHRNDIFNEEHYAHRTRHSGRSRSSRHSRW